MSKSKNYITNLPTHLEGDNLIAYLDGELSEEEKQLTSKHLENCWECRRGLKAMQDSIENFMNLRQEKLIPRELPPSEPALKIFQKRLQNYKSQNSTVSVFKVSSWKSKISSTFQSLTKSLSPLPARIGIAALVVVVITGLLFNQLSVKTVSAAELLNNADEARKSALAKIPVPVIYQKIQIRQIKNNSQVSSVNLETWEDTTGNNFREAIETVDGRRFIENDNLTINASETLGNKRPVLLDEIVKILRFNQMNSDRPLAADSVKAWRDSLERKQEDVIKTTADDGTEVFDLKIVPLGEINNGQILKADYMVRADDWTSLRLRLVVKDNTENVIFEITRQTLQILALNQLSPDIFPNIQITKLPDSPISPNVNSSPQTKIEVNSNTNSNTNTNTTELAATENNIKRPKATAELEIEVLGLLNQAKADLGEQLEVKRTSAGTLRISGIVETSQRKSEIINALKNVADNPAVTIDILTAEEYVARQRSEKSAKEVSTDRQNVEVQKNTFPAGNDLQAYFAKQGGNSEEAARRFSTRMVVNSRGAAQHLFAMRNLFNKFSADEKAKFTPETRAKWLSLIKGHARAYQEKSAALRRELKPIFFSGSSESVIKADISTDKNADLGRAINQLLSVGISNDSIVRSAFTALGGQSKVSVIKNPQVWNSMKSAEGLALAIQASK